MAEPQEELPSRKQFSVAEQDGIINYQDVSNYMIDSDNKLGDLNAGNGDLIQHLNPNLFQIISTGINNIVNQLKNNLGVTFLENNINAKAIMNSLYVLKTTIDENVDQIGKNDGIDNIDAIQIKKGTNGKYETRNKYVDYYGDATISSDNINTNPNLNFKDLDSNHISVLEGDLQANKFSGTDNIKITIKEDGTINNDSILMTRLKNCQNLEFLYLKKHDEIMKVFAFTINLFDKYKYAVKVMLYLLKHLVKKDYMPDNLGKPVPVPGETKYINTPTPMPLQIKLPKTIIKNISKLLEDQKIIQGVITNMDNTLKEKILTNGTTDISNLDRPNEELGVKPAPPIPPPRGSLQPPPRGSIPESS